jgi:uncharacterized protein HemX
VNFWQTLLMNVLVTVVAGGGLVGMLTLRGQRRKLGADADVGMATAAQTLTGSALEMVKHAENRAAAAEKKADHAEQEALEAQHRLSRLIQWIRTQGMTPPDWIEGSRNG